MTVKLYSAPDSDLKADTSPTLGVDTDVCPQLLPIQPNNKKNITVALLYQDYGQLGGIEQTILKTAQQLTASSLIHPVVICSDETPFYWQLKKEGLKVYGIKSRSFFGKSFLRTLDFSGLKQIKTIVQQMGADLLHVHFGLQENIWLKQQLGCPVMYTFHGYGALFSDTGCHPVFDAVKYQFKQWSKKAFQQTVSQVDCLIWVSQAEHRRMFAEGYLSDSKIGRVIHNGIDVQTVARYCQTHPKATAKLDLGLGRDKQCIVFIGRLDENKNPMAFLRLAEKLQYHAEAEGLPPYEFVIAGDGDLYPAVLKKSQSVENVHVLGYQPSILPVLAAADLWVSTSYKEGFGLSMLEAMAAGVPCLSYKTCGAEEIFSENKILPNRENRVSWPKDSLSFTQLQETCLVPLGNETALFATAKYLLASKNPILPQLKADLVALAARFDIKHYTQELVMTYKTLVNPKLAEIDLKPDLEKSPGQSSTFYQEIIQEPFTPLVSVVLPVYNGQKTIGRAVQSVLNQSYTNLELLVVDDGSTDGTMDCLKKITDPRFTLISQKNSGVAAARNTGVRQASGDYLAFIDADDLWLDRKLKTEVQIAKEYSSPDQLGLLVYSSYFAVDDQDRLFNLPSIVKQDGDLSQLVLEQEGVFLPSTTFMHRSVFDRVGGFPLNCHYEDFVFFATACQHFKAYSTEQRLVVYRQSTAGRCRSVLNDYQFCVDAEDTCIEALTPVLGKAQCQQLKIRQYRNLMYRFLMYGYTANAKQLFQQIKNQTTVPRLLGGLKGKLAQVSLMTGINVLMPVRITVQRLTQIILKPVWLKKFKKYTAS
ncbi:MAG: glycosyltransferase [Cyanobacteria bacterium P01_H01_bin.74]